MSHFYLHYHPADTSFALEFSAGLKKLGFNIWMDKFDSGIHEQALQNSTGIIEILSPSATSIDHSGSSASDEKPLYIVLIEPARNPISGEILHTFSNPDDKHSFQKHLLSTIAVLREKHSSEFGTLPSKEADYLIEMIVRIEQYNIANHLVYNSGRLVCGKLSFQSEVKEEDSEYETVFSNLQQALERYPQFILRGASGSGKTTLLYQLGLETARKRLQDPDYAQVPIIIHLETWDNEDTFLDFVQVFWKLNTRPKEVLEDTLFLLDGLEKIPSSKIDQFKQWLVQEQARLNAIICSSSDIEINLSWPKINVVIEDEQIHTFTKYYLDSQSDLLLQRIFKTRRRHLYYLAHDLHILRLLVFMHANAEASDFPKSLGQLYGTLSYLLWQRYNDLADWIDFDQAEQSLAKIAFDMFETQRLIAQDSIDNIPELKIAWQAGLLIGKDDGIEFRYNFFREYLVARRLFDEDANDIFDLVSEPYLFFMGRQPAKWDDVIVVFSGLLQEPVGFIQGIASIDPFLAGKCIAGGIDIPNALTQELLQILQAMLWDAHPGIRVAAAKVLGDIADPSTVPALIRAMRGSHESATFLNFEDLLMDSLNIDISKTEIGNTPELMNSLRQTNALDGFAEQAIAEALVAIGSEAIQGLLEIIADANLDHSKGFTALMALKQIGDPLIVPRLLEILRSGNQHGQMIAMFLKDFEKDAISGLLGSLEAQDPTVRNAAIWGVMGTADSVAIPTLITLLDDELETVRMGAAVALAQFGATSVPDLLRALDHNYPERCEIILEIFEHTGEQATASLLRALDTPDSHHLAYIASALAKIGLSTIPDLVEKLNSGNIHERLGASWALGIMGSPADQELVKILDHKEKEMRMVALSGLSRTENPEAIRKILEILIAGDTQERKQALSVLISTNRPEAITGLITYLSDDEIEIKQVAADKLVSFGELAVPKLLEVIYGNDDDARVIAAGILGTIGKPAKAGLVHSLNDRRGLVRLAARMALGKIENNPTPRLVEMITDEEVSSEGRIIAVRLLGQMNGIQSFFTLLQTSCDKNWEVRTEAIDALIQLDSDVVPRLLNVAQDRNEQINLRVGAVVVLAMMHDTQTIAPLRNILVNEKNPQLKLALLIALEKNLDSSLLEIFQNALTDNNFLVRTIAQDALKRQKL